MGTIGTTWELMKASWGVVKSNKKLLILPIFSSICLILVIASFAAPVILDETNMAILKGERPDETFSFGYLTPPNKESTTADKVRFGVVAFGFYFANYFVIIFFNSAIIASALFWMRDGGEVSLSRGLGAAASRLPQILGWALVSATVGLLLKMLESNRKGSSIVAAILGTAWTIMTYLAVPVLVVEGKGPVGALKESVSLLKKSWGQQLVGSFGFGIIWFLLSLVGFAILGGGLYAANAAGSPTIAALAVGAAAIYFIGLILVSSVMTPVFQAALYVYAKEGHAPGSFGQGLLENAFHTKA